MVVARKALDTEKVRWMEECMRDDCYMYIEDILINSIHDGAERVSLLDARQIFLDGNENTLTTHLDLNPTAIGSILSGRDKYFRLEKISVTKNDEIKLYFGRKVLIVYSLTVDRSLFPSFTVVLKRVGCEVVSKARITVRENYQVCIDRLW